MDSLKRQRHEMPEFVALALIGSQLMDAYLTRPPYQQNDYIGWINNAKRPETQQKRLAQMLEELESSDRYMKMVWRPKRR